MISSFDSTPSVRYDENWYESTTRKPGTFSLLQARTLKIVVGAAISLLILLAAAAGLTLRSAGSASEAMTKGRYEQARAYYLSAADKGDNDALNALGNLHYLGLGGQTDYRRAAELYFKAAAQGHAGAQLNLAHLFKQGFGVNTDLMRAYAWYRMSDISGSPWAEYYITQTALEYTLSPMQMATAKERFSRLRMLVAAGLQ